MNSDASKSGSVGRPFDDELTDDDLDIVSGGVVAGTTTCTAGSYPAKLTCKLGATCSGNPAVCSVTTIGGL